MWCFSEDNGRYVVVFFVIYFWEFGLLYYLFRLRMFKKVIVSFIIFLKYMSMLYIKFVVFFKIFFGWNECVKGFLNIVVEY